MKPGETRNIVIAGSGPAGYTAAIYASRAGLAPLLFEGYAPGGQLTVTTDVENFPGFAEPVSGPDLMAAMRAQAERVGVEIVTDEVRSVALSSRPFEVRYSGGEILARALIVATGAEARWLGIQSEEAFRGRGISACATCDGFFFKNRKIAVVGGGDTACEEALYLTNHAAEVLLIHRRGELRASRVMRERVLSHPKIRPLWHRVVAEYLGGEAGLTGVRLEDPRSGETETVDLEGVFVAIGHRPNTGFLEGQLELDAAGYVATEPGTTRTSVPGVFAAGDVRDPTYRQAVTAAGTGCMAAVDAGRFLEEND